MKTGPRKPLCSDCPCSLYYEDPIPKRQFNVMMRMGEHYCIGGKQAKRFKKSDPKIYIPSWCPKRKNPCELRVYGFKTEEDKLMHMLLCYSVGQAISPSESRYTLEHSSHTKLSPSEFWKQCDLEPVENLIPVKVGLYQVLEIDDGLQPAFFYQTEQGLQYLSSFKSDAIRKNRKGD